MIFITDLPVNLSFIYCFCANSEWIYINLFSKRCMHVAKCFVRFARTTFTDSAINKKLTVWGERWRHWARRISTPARLYQIRWRTDIDESCPCSCWYCTMCTDAGPRRSPGPPPGLYSAARVTADRSRWTILWGGEQNKQWESEQSMWSSNE